MKVRSYQKNDEVKILDLDDRALPSDWNRRTPENWKWKFSEVNPNGHALIWVAEHNEQMLAHFAAVRYKLKTYDQVVEASHSIGALVEPKYQRRGLLKLVGDKLMEDLVAHEIPYTWGFPNKRAHQFENVALGYQDLANFDVWRLEKDKIKKTQPNPNIRKLSQFGREVDKLWETVSPGYHIAVVRSSDYLNWRFINRPDWEYFCFGLYNGETLAGYVVLKLYREGETLRGHIVDIFARRDDKETLAQLIHHSLNFFIQKEVDEITVWILGNPLIEKLFTQLSFDRVSANIPLILRVNTKHKHWEKVADPANWYFTMGDSTEIF